MVTTRRGRPHHPITTRRSRRYHSTVTIHRFLVTYGSQARILWPKSGVQGCRGSLGCSGRKVVVIMVDGTYRAGGRGVVGADGLTSSSASGSAQPRRSESADPHAEGAATKPAVQRWFRRERAEGRLRSDPHPSTHHRGRAGRGGRRAGEPDAGLWFRLVDRDRRVLALLAEHKVLTTNQIAAIEFLSVRRAQDRLRHLRELGWCSRSASPTCAAGRASPATRWATSAHG
jgi:hypothetical protein